MAGACSDVPRLDQTTEGKDEAARAAAIWNLSEGIDYPPACIRSLGCHCDSVNMGNVKRLSDLYPSGCQECPRRAQKDLHVASWAIRKVYGARLVWTPPTDEVVNDRAFREQ